MRRTPSSFGSPTYMGGPSRQFKKFADASSKAGSAASGRTKCSAAYQQRQPERRQAGHVDRAERWLLHGGLWVSQGCCRPTPNRRSAPTSITGRFGGAAGADPADAGRIMLSGDLATAKLYGQRVAVLPPNWRRSPVQRGRRATERTPRSFSLHNWRVSREMLLACLG